MSATIEAQLLSSANPNMPLHPSRTVVCAALLAGASLGCDTTISPVTGGDASTQPEPLLVVGFEPQPGSIEVGPQRTFRIDFSEKVAPESMGTAPVTMVDTGSGNPLQGKVTLGPGGSSVIFEPHAIPPGPTYCLSLDPALRGESGGALEIPAGSPIAGCAGVYSTHASNPILSGAISAEPRSSSAVEVSWENASDADSSPSVLVYEVFAAPDPGPISFASPALVSPQGVTAGLLTGLVPNTLYLFRVRARDPLGNVSEPSAEAAAKTEGSNDGTPPAFASGIQLLVPISPTALRASWSAASDDRDPPELIRYNAYVSLGPGGQDFGAPAGPPSPPGATSLEIGNLAPDTLHHVVIRAVDTAGNEDANVVELGATTLVSFTTNIFPILTRIDMGGCSRATCHSGPTPDGELDMTTYDGLIRGGVTKQPPTVKPFDGKGSYIMWRTDRMNPNFRSDLIRMPSGGRALPDPQLRQIERWIDQGAENN